MEEYIGKVKLDYTWYPGVDLYSDGEVEDKLLEIAMMTPPGEMNRVIADEKDWAVLYHMSHVREHIVESLPIGKNEKVLEIGAGCGAITGSLARRAGSVTCVDLSKKRSMVNAYRHKDMDNIRILVGNFQDIEKNLTEKYDCITLIGVFEYARGYIGTDRPYEEFLRQIGSHLTEDGRIIIAIENRLGLKYWAGCREDHTGTFFEGLEDYPDPETMVHTFSKPELEEIFDTVGLKSRRFFYPYPDYKLPMCIFSDDHLPAEGELITNNWNFDRDRMVLFDETKVYDSLIRTGQFSQFSNSYLVVLKRTGVIEAPVYTKYADERCTQLAIRTDILSEDGVNKIRKTAVFPEGKAHIHKIACNAKALEELFAGTRIKINRILDEDTERGSVDLAYAANTVSLENTLASMWKNGQSGEARVMLRGLAGLFAEKAGEPFVWTEQFGELFGCDSYPFTDKTMPVTDLDMVGENFLLDQKLREDCTLIDYEWTYSFPIPVRFVIYRLIHYFLARNAITDAYGIWEEMGISAQEQVFFQEMERSWQKSVLKGHAPLRELYGKISPGLMTMGAFAQDTKLQSAYKTTIYYCDKNGTVIREAQSESMKITGGNRFSVTFTPDPDMEYDTLRWDPLEGHSCKVKIERISSDGMLRIIPINGFHEQDGWDTFWTNDPAYTLSEHRYGRKTEQFSIEGRLELVNISQNLEEFSQIRRERDAYYQEMENLRAQIAAMKHTKAYMAIEGARRVRNYSMARIRGTKMFQDPDAGSRKFQEWISAHLADPEELAAQRMTVLPRNPLISILVPVYRTPEEYLRPMIQSVLDQTYTNWELCIADGSREEDQKTADIIREYAKNDPRIKLAVLEENSGISENTNAAAKLASGSFIGLLDHDDLLTPDALFEMVQAIIQTDAELVYSDEDKINMSGTGYFDANLKPDYSPDLIRSHNYITHFLIISAQLFEEVGGFHKEFDGAQDHDLILRCVEKTERIVHVPKILYHWRSHIDSTAQNPKSKLYAYEAGRKAIEEHLHRIGIPATVERSKYWGLNHVFYPVPEDAFLSIVIPNKDHVKDLDRCIRSIVKESDFKNYEILVVENNSEEKATFAYYRKLKEEFPQVRILRWEKGFNYSAINNYAVRNAKGNYILLLNNDTQLIEKGSLAEMIGLCAREDVGCVGAKLLFANNTVQHAGIVLGFGGFAGHVFSGIDKESVGFMMRPLMAGNYSAVTAACLMVRKDVYEEVGGLGEDLAVALNDVDFCLKVRAAGYLNVYTPYSLWHHYESLSRGYEETPEKKERFGKELAVFRSRWAKVVDAPDPYYNPNFSMQDPPFTLW